MPTLRARVAARMKDAGALVGEATACLKMLTMERGLKKMEAAEEAVMAAEETAVVAAGT